MTSKKEKKPKVSETDEKQQENEPISANAVKETSSKTTGAKLNLAKIEKQLIKATGEKAAELRK